MSQSIDITASNRIPLPGGHWADLRPVQDITERRRRPIKKMSASLLANEGFAQVVREVRASGKDPETLPEAEKVDIAARMGSVAFDELEDVQDLLVVAAVRGWSFTGEDGQVLPVTVEGILDVPGGALDALRNAVRPYQNALRGEVAEPDPDPASPTAPSSD